MGGWLRFVEGGTGSKVARPGVIQIGVRIFSNRLGAPTLSGAGGKSCATRARAAARTGAAGDASRRSQAPI